MRRGILRTTVGRSLAVSALLVGLAVEAHATPSLDMPVYTGYGTPTRVRLSGRVLQEKSVGEPDPNRSAIGNVVDTIKLLESDEVPGVDVVVTCGEHTWKRRTDDDGLWEVSVDNVDPPLPVGRHVVGVELAAMAPEANGVGTVIVIADVPGVAVISDFDDTVVETGVSDKVEMAARTLTRNAAQMEPVPGVGAAFRAAMDAGATATFYLSGSPQNLYERISDFLRLHELPAGAILLKNVGRDPLIDQKSFKSKRIDQLMLLFPQLRFIFVGDSGEADPEIYAAARKARPKRIVGILIRRVPEDASPASRFAGMEVVADYSVRPKLLADWVRGAAGK